MSPTFLWVSKYDVKLGSRDFIFKIHMGKCVFEKSHAKSVGFQVVIWSKIWDFHTFRLAWFLKGFPAKFGGFRKNWDFHTFHLAWFLKGFQAKFWGFRKIWDFHTFRLAWFLKGFPGKFRGFRKIWDFNTFRLVWF